MRRPATAGTRAGRWPVQLRFATALTSESYVSLQAWREASLPRCPLHPGGGCGWARHGTYARVRPAGARVPRWYCRAGHRTFSLLPDCLAARLPGTLEEVERVVAAAEQAKSLEAAADKLRPDIELPGGIRWVRRRVKAIHNALTTLLGLLPEHFAGAVASVVSVRAHLMLIEVLPALREVAAPFLAGLAPPLGLCPPPGVGGDYAKSYQQYPGPDPPRASG
jgi:hypothetical protein